MNYRRMLLGGLLAGLVINASEFVLNGVVLAGQMQADMERMGLVFTSWAMAAFVVMAFVYGLCLAWLYAAIRPRFGPGPRTSVIAGAALWLAAYLLPTVAFLAMGASSPGSYGLAVLWGAVEVLVASLLAGWLYREA